MPHFATSSKKFLPASPHFYPIRRYFPSRAVPYGSKQQMNSQPHPLNRPTFRMLQISHLPLAQFAPNCIYDIRCGISITSKRYYSQGCGILRVEKKQHLSRPPVMPYWGPRRSLHSGNQHQGQAESKHAAVTLTVRKVGLFDIAC